MPYVITAKTPTRPEDGPALGLADPIPSRVTRHAVATLDEARTLAQQISDDLRGQNPGLPTMPDLLRGCARYWPSGRSIVTALPEAGGTVGPLPDGTVIEVERVTWSDMAEDGGIQLRYDPPTHDGDYLHDRQRDELLALVAAFNAAQEGSR